MSKRPVPIERRGREVEEFGIKIKGTPLWKLNRKIMAGIMTFTVAFYAYFLKDLVMSDEPKAIHIDNMLRDKFNHYFNIKKTEEGRVPDLERRLKYLEDIQEQSRNEKTTDK